jgi:hypothetical protein
MTTVIVNPAAISDTVPLAHTVPGNEESVSQNGTEDVGAVTTKKKKKKKPKKPKPSPLVAPATSAVGTQDAKQSILCISRNKHWRYISSYHVGLFAFLTSTFRQLFFCLGSMASATYRNT